MGGNSRLKQAFVVAGGNFGALDVSTRYTSQIAADYLSKLNTRCPLATPIEITPRTNEENREKSPLPKGSGRLAPLSKRVPPTQSPQEDNSQSSSDKLPQVQTVSTTHRARYPYSSIQRWTHLPATHFPTIADNKRNIPIFCSGATPRVEKNCIVSSFETFKMVLLRICP